ALGTGSAQVCGVRPLRAAPAGVECVVMKHVGPEHPTGEAADAIEDRTAVDGEHCVFREPLPDPAPEPVARGDTVAEVVSAQHTPARDHEYDPKGIPDAADATVVGSSVRDPGARVCVGPCAQRVEVRREGEEQHDPDGVADIREGVEPESEHEADGPAGVSRRHIDDSRNDDTKREGMGKAHAGPTAVELHRIARSEVQAGEAQPVYEPLGEDVRAPRAKYERGERDRDRSPPELSLQDVRLQVVRNPAHRRSRLARSGRSQVQRRSQAKATTQKVMNGVKKTLIATYESP